MSMIVLMCFVLTLSNKYICEIYEGREIHRRYVQADTLLLSVTVEDLNL